MLMALFFIFATVVGTPGALMTIGTGFVLHAVYDSLWKSILVGTLTVYLGTWIGSSLAFLIGRYVLRDLTKRLNSRYKVMKALDWVL